MHTMQVSNDLYNVISIFAERDSISLTRVLKKAMVAYAEAKESSPSNKASHIQPFFGIWKDYNIDGLEYQKQLRNEWER